MGRPLSPWAIFIPIQTFTKDAFFQAKSDKLLIFRHFFIK